jgi:putative radical SAM enzyme (TIGR03279 family)
VDEREKNMKKNRHVVREVLKGSIAEELHIEPGDEIVRINGEEAEDIFDYQYLMQDEYVEILLRKASGEEWLLEVEKDEDEDLGAVFENSLMDEYRSCRNHCIFCFIDQMPPGMRKTLYFKDDDSRLSFLQGNYVTLTNMSDHDIDRIIRYHLSPINISFHTTNPGLRCRMLNNRFAGDFADKVRRLKEAGIEMNGQIVLCRGINDGPELDRSLSDLSGYFPELRSVSVVPVGLTRYRDGLYPLEPFGKEEARQVLAQIHRWQKAMYEKEQVHFVHASDEWYLLAEEPLPEQERYDGYPQLENGVGMLRLLEEEVKEELKARPGDRKERRVSIATGLLAAPFLEKLLAGFRDRYPGLHAEVFPIRNEFFGERITVSGLITGRDLIRQLGGKDLGERLLLPCNMLRDGENVFLDDVSVEEVERELHVPVQVTDEGGKAFCEAVLEENTVLIHKRRQMYEQTDRSDSGQA